VEARQFLSETHIHVSPSIEEIIQAKATTAEEIKTIDARIAELRKELESRKTTKPAPEGKE